MSQGSVPAVPSPRCEEAHLELMATRFHSLVSIMGMQLDQLERNPLASTEAIKKALFAFLEHFQPLSHPEHYNEFSDWHRERIQCHDFINHVAYRLHRAVMDHRPVELLLITKMLGILVRNAENRVTLQRCGGVRTLMKILKLNYAKKYSEKGDRSTMFEMDSVADENFNSLNTSFERLSMSESSNDSQEPKSECSSDSCSCESCLEPYATVLGDRTDPREEACIVLRRLALDMPPAREICRLGGIQTLLWVITDTTNSLELREKACSVLGNSFCTSADKDRFLAHNGFSIILSAFRASVGHVHFLEVYCRTIANAIANCPGNKNAFAQQGGIGLILDNIVKQPLHSEFLTMALRVLTNVSRCNAGINEIAQHGGMTKLIQLSSRIEHVKIPGVRTSVDRGMLYCIEEFVFKSSCFNEFCKDGGGVNMLISIMNRVRGEHKLLLAACKTAREVLHAASQPDVDSMGDSVRVGWLRAIETAVDLLRDYPYYGEYAEEFPLEAARIEARPVVSCEPGPPAKRVRFYLCHLIEDIVRAFPRDARKQIDTIYFDSLAGMETLDLLPRELVRLLCEFLPVQEWTG